MALHVALRQTRHREFGLGRRRKRIQPPLDAVDDLGGPLAGLFGGQFAEAPERGALRPVRAARLHDEDLAPAGIDPETEALQIPIPEHRIAAVAGQRVDGSFGQRHHDLLDHCP